MRAETVMAEGRYGVVLTDEALEILSPLLDLFMMRPIVAGGKNCSLVCERVDFSGLLVELGVLDKNGRGPLSLWLHSRHILFAADYRAAGAIGFRPE